MKTTHLRPDDPGTLVVGHVERKGDFVKAKLVIVANGKTVELDFSTDEAHADEALALSKFVDALTEFENAYLHAARHAIEE